MFSYYRKFIRNYSEIAQPLTQLTKQDAKWEWGACQQRAMELLLGHLVVSSILWYPDFSRRFKVFTEECEYGIGVVIAQDQPNETNDTTEVVVAYASRHLLEREAKWSVVEKEALAIVYAVEIFYPYLYGRAFDVITDHNPLQWLMNVKKPSGRLTRWALLLQSFDLTVVYRPGKKHANADGLSRHPNPDGILPTLSLDDQCVYSIDFLVDDWIAAQNSDPYCSEVRRRLDRVISEDDPDHNPDDMQYIILDNGLLARCGGEILVPAVKGQEVLQRFHDHRLAAHGGGPKTILRITPRFTWPTLQQDVRMYVKGCILCAKHKAHGGSTSPLTSLPATTYF